MKPIQTVLIAAFVAVVASYATAKMTNSVGGTVADNKQESVFDRIMRTRTIRCGYVSYAPYLIRDANTGKFSGIFYDLTEKMGKLLNLKIDWVYETSFATFLEDMKMDRFDVFCSNVWPESAKSQGLLYTTPVNYVGLGIYARIDDTRFDNGYAILNDEAYTFSAQDGEMSQLIKQEDFPKAKELSHAQNVSISQLLLDVVNKKADVVIVEKSIVADFEHANPNSLKDVTHGNVIRLYPNTWAVKMGEHNLLGMLNTTIQELHNFGFVEKTVKAHEKVPNSFFPLANPYKTGE